MMRVLVLNGGSSTFKCWYGELSDPVHVQAQPPRWRQIEWTGAAAPALDQDIAAADSNVRVLVLRAEKDWEIAREYHRVLQGFGHAA